MAEASDDFLLVQVAGVGLQAAYGLHPAVQDQGVVPRHGHGRGRAVVKLVQLVGLQGEGRCFSTGFSNTLLR